MRVILLTNFIPPYRVPVFAELARRVSRLRLLVSTKMEPNREWPAAWDGLDVAIQRGFTLRRTWRHPHGFSEEIYVHVPLDTFWQLRAFAADAVVSAEMGMRTLLATLYARFRRGTQLVVWATLSEYTEQGRGRLREWVRRWILRRADAVLVNGESGARYIRRFGVSDDRIIRVPQTPALEPFLRAPVTRSPDAARRLLFVGRLVELKGLHHLLSALCRRAGDRPDERISLTLVGDGPLRAVLQAQAALAPANLEVTLVGSLPYDELPQWYARFGILVLPTLSDEWGLVVNEAMAAGLPVLGSVYSQAVEELVEDGRSGWTFRPDQPDQIDDALDRALTAGTDALDTMRRAARERARAITPALVANRILNALSRAG